MQESGDPPQRPDPPSDAPVIDSDEDLGRFGGGEPDLDGDRALLRVLGLVVLLGVMIAALLLPPISLLDRGGDGDGVVGSARQSLPALPRGLIALSALHDLQGATSAPPPYRLRVRLTEQTDDGQNMALYTFDAGGWRRLATASLVDGGRTAEGQVDSIPDAIAVLRRTAFARSLGLVIGAGEVPDAAAPSAAIVSVVAAAPVVAPEGAGASVRVEAGALEAALAAGRASVYLGVAAPAEEDAAALDAILATPELTAAHAVDVANAAIEAGASGVHIDYSTLAPEQREALTAFAVALAAALEPEGMGLVMSLPTPSAGVAGAYDWESLSAAADVLWLRGPEDPEAYYQLLEPALETLAGAGTEMDALWLLVDRRSHERAPGGAVQAISLLDALTTASIVRTQIEGVGIRPGDGVTVRGVNIDRSDAANSGIAWDETALAVGFSYAGRSVWMENRFSVAFRLDLAHRYGLGGVVVAPGAADGALPDIWAPVAGFVEDGSVRLELPYGPYLEPSWGPPSATFDGSGADGVAVWRAPEQIGIHEVRLVVSEGTVFVGQEMLLRVTADVERTAPAPGPTPTPSPTATPAPTSSPTATAAPTSTATPSPTATPAPTSSPTATPTPSPTATPAPTSSPTATPTPTPSPTPSPTPTPTPSGPPGPAGNG